MWFNGLERADQNTLKGRVAIAAALGDTERAIQLFLAQKLHVRVATIPSGKDPCDFVIAQGPEALQKLIDNAPDALQYAWDIRHDALQRDGADNPTERNRLIDELHIAWSFPECNPEHHRLLNPYQKLSRR